MSGWLVSGGMALPAYDTPGELPARGRPLGGGRPSLPLDVALGLDGPFVSAESRDGERCVQRCCDTLADLLALVAEYRRRYGAPPEAFDWC